MKKTEFMKAHFLWGLLLLTISLFAGSCSNDNKETVAPAPEFELVTEIDATNPVFISPDKNFKIEYNAKNIKSVATNTLPEGWTAEIDESGSCINVKAAASATSKVKLTITATGEDTQKV